MRLLLMADIHIGSIKDTTYVYNVLTDIIEKEVILTHTDAVIILGDYFDRLFKVNEEYVSLAINVMSYLIRACTRSKTKIRIIYGTESHEMAQYKLFNYHFTSSNIDIRVIDTACSEELFPRVPVLYLPEEFVESKEDRYVDLFKNKYQYIFGHGTIEEAFPFLSTYKGEPHQKKEKHVPTFKSGELAAISDLTVFGHYHCYTEMPGNVYYLGSLFRNAFGEEIPKGYGIIEDGKFQFVENTAAYIYKTYDFKEDDPIFQNADQVIRALDKIREENPEIFSGERTGKIRIRLQVPPNLDPSFRENLRVNLLNDKHFTTLFKESTSDIIEEVRDDVGDEFEFLLDPSLPIEDKIHRYITKLFDEPMTLAELKEYINKPIT